MPRSIADILRAGRRDRLKSKTDLSPHDAAAICMNQVAPLPVEWLWPGYIPAGMITLLDGDPGLGKSWLTIDLAARVSRGWPMPPEVGPTAVRPPAGVLLCNAEDDPARTLRPRLDQAGADVSRVHLPDLRREDGWPRPVVLPDDLPSLAHLIQVHEVRLVVIDPLMAFLTGKVDSHKDSDVRRVLHQLKDLAERTRAAILIVRHLNKQSSVHDPLYRGGGSIGIIGAARSALLVGRHPFDDRQRVLTRSKGNLSAPPPALAFALERGQLGWIGPVTISATELLGGKSEGKARDAASAWLLTFLAKGPRSSEEVLASGAAAGHAERTLRRAAKELGVQCVRPTERKAPWTWTLPSQRHAGPAADLG
jgi:hypothetical protein